MAIGWKRRIDLQVAEQAACFVQKNKADSTCWLHEIQGFLLGTSKICFYAFAIRTVRMIAEAENRSGLCDSRKRKWIADFFLQRGFLLSILKK